MKNTQKGFTIVEVTVLIVILLVISAAGWTVYNKKYSDSKTKVVQIETKKIQTGSGLDGPQISDRQLPPLLPLGKTASVMDEHETYSFDDSEHQITAKLKTTYTISIQKTVFNPPVTGGRPLKPGQQYVEVIVHIESKTATTPQNYSQYIEPNYEVPGTFVYRTAKGAIRLRSGSAYSCSGTCQSDSLEARSENTVSLVGNSMLPAPDYIERLLFEIPTNDNGTVLLSRSHYDSASHNTWVGNFALK